MERAIARNRSVLDNGAKANTIGKYAAENGNAAAIKRFRASHDIRESTMPLFYSRSATSSVKESCGGCGQT